MRGLTRQEGVQKNPVAPIKLGAGDSEDEQLFPTVPLLPLHYLRRIPEDAG